MTLFKTKKTRIVLCFKSTQQLPIILLLKEKYDNDILLNVRILFMLEGRKQRKMWNDMLSTK